MHEEERMVVTARADRTGEELASADRRLIIHPYLADREFELGAAPT